MEALTAVHDGEDDANIGAEILMRFTNSYSEVDLQVRKLIIVMSGLFRDQNEPPTPAAYLEATCSSLDATAASEPQPPAHVVDAHLTILSILIAKVPAAFLINNLRRLFDCMARPLWSSPPIYKITKSECLKVKCIAQLFIAVAKFVNNWSDVSEVYGSFLSLAFLKCHKVRSQLDLCLPDVLRSFQGTPLFAPSTKQITDMLNKYPPVVDYDHENASASVRSQQTKALATLDVVKVSLSLLSDEDKTAVLVYYRTLLELNQFSVTKPIVDVLYTLCLDPSAYFSPELLLDLVLSVCLFVTQHKMISIPSTTPGFLSTGVTRLYSFNQKICEVNLPLVFDALKVILEDPNTVYDPNPEHAFKCLIHACIDESLIKCGVDHMVMIASMGDGLKSEPTIIEKLCATIQSLLYLKPTDQSLLKSCEFTTFVWGPAFEVVSTMFDKLGPYSFHLMRVTLKTLANMQKYPDREFHFKEEKVKSLLEKLVKKYGFDALLAIMPQELKNLLVEINEKATIEQKKIKEMAYKSVEVISHVRGANAVSSESGKNQLNGMALGPCKNSKRKMDGRRIGLREAQAMRKAKRQMTNMMSDAAVMTWKLNISRSKISDFDEISMVRKLEISTEISGKYRLQ